jgi:hypothetical protein
MNLLMSIDRHRVNPPFVYCYMYLMNQRFKLLARASTQKLEIRTRSTIDRPTEIIDWLSVILYHVVKPSSWKLQVSLADGCPDPKGRSNL